MLFRRKKAKDRSGKKKKYVELTGFHNGTNREISIFLELSHEQIVLSPGHEIRLLADNNPGYLPLDIIHHDYGIQVYSRNGSPDWMIEFKGALFKPGFPTILREIEARMAARI